MEHYQEQKQALFVEIMECTVAPGERKFLSKFKETKQRDTTKNYYYYYYTSVPNKFGLVQYFIKEKHKKREIGLGGGGENLVKLWQVMEEIKEGRAC